MIRVVLAEDQTMMLSAISTVLELERDIQVVAIAHDGRAALAAVVKHGPDVLVADIEMPRLDGITLAREASRSLPPAKVIILTTFSRSGYVSRAIDAGIGGYLLKDATPDELADAIRSVNAGRRWISDEMASRAWEGRDPLTDRQRAIMRLVEVGKSNRDIANELHLSYGTIRNYVHDAMSRLGASNRVEAVRIARENGWL